MDNHVDPVFWRVEAEFCPAGGPLVHRLTDVGRLRAFRVGSNTTEDAARVLLALAAEDAGTAAIESRCGHRVTLTDFGRMAAPHATAGLTDRGLIEMVTGDVRAYRLTNAGHVAVEQGFAECDRLIDRIRKAHPIHRA